MAKSFTFNTTRSLVYELGASRTRLAGIVKASRCKNILLVTDPGIQKAGLLQPVQKGLMDAGIHCTVFDRVVADPPVSVVLEASNIAKQANVDGVVGVGGGSSMDVAKLVAFLNGTTTQQLDDMYGVGNCVGDRLPLIQVPTTAGTGSEVTPISILTTGASEKKGIVSNQLYPDCALLDGELTLSIPKHVTAATGLDAMVHAIEAYTTKNLKNPLSDLLAREALRLLAGNLRTVCFEGSNAEARGEMLLGAMYAGMAFSNAPVAAVHALAYPLGSHFKVPHGLSNSIMLPHILRFNSQTPLADQLYSEIVGIIFGGAGGSGEGGERMADGFKALALELGIETTLREVGVKEGDIGMLASEAMKQTRLLPNNLREVTEADAVELYTKAF